MKVWFFLQDIKALEESHKVEMKIMQDRLHLEMEEKVKKLRAMHLVSYVKQLLDHIRSGSTLKVMLLITLLHSKARCLVFFWMR